ncbi:MAG: type III-A CRISPR-associated RAMP protein Csm5 [Syntrophaceae bacterium]|nr:type III-A CRISPR-associated RAMP protein Csm5 [Syntrophaceae bacterium]
MKIKIEILTPLHIGSGEDISPSEYLVDTNLDIFSRLNMDALFHDLSFKKYMDRFISEACRQRYIGSIIDHSLLKKYPLYSIPISGEAKSYIANNQTNVRALIKTGGRVFIPGSSIKGSILSALMWHVLKNNYGVSRTKIHELITKRPQNRREEGEAYNELLKLSLSLISPDSKKGRFSQWVNLSDSTCNPPQESIEIYLSRVKGARWGGELPILFEGIKKGQTFETELSIVGSKFSEKEILETVHDFYLKVADYDEVNVDKQPYLLRLGQGSTVYATSLLILARDLGIKDYRVSPPRTRKRIDDKIPMGFVRLTL